MVKSESYIVSLLIVVCLWFGHLLALQQCVALFCRDIRGLRAQRLTNKSQINANVSLVEQSLAAAFFLFSFFTPDAVDTVHLPALQWTDGPRVRRQQQKLCDCGVALVTRETWQHWWWTLHWRKSHTQQFFTSSSSNLQRWGAHSTGRRRWEDACAPCRQTFIHLQQSSEVNQPGYASQSSASYTRALLYFIHIIISVCTSVCRQQRPELSKAVQLQGIAFYYKHANRLIR